MSSGSSAHSRVSPLRVVPSVSRDERLAFERLLSDLSTTFINLPGDEVDDEISNALKRLIDFLGFDRSSFGEYSQDLGTLNVLCTVAVEGVELMPLGPFPKAFTWFLGELRAERIVSVSSIEDLPPDAVVEREYMRQSGLRSNLSIPLGVGGRLVGVIAFGAFRSTRVWPDDLIARLKIVGEVFTQAIARSRNEKRLESAFSEIEQLKEKLQSENVYLKETIKARAEHGQIRTNSVRFGSLLDRALQVAATNSIVLLMGETGTGKEILAGAIHDASPRREKPMIKVNCAALPSTLIEAELFGREKGAYTGALTRQVGRFELAHEATIFLDEIGELPTELQPKLLRVLQDGCLERIGGIQTIKVDVRVIAATNRNLANAVRDGSFRQDLFYRLNVFPLVVPPLRERREDIPMLAWTFAQQLGQSMGKPVERIPQETMTALQQHPWPGNVRELRNVIERAIIMATSSTLRVELEHSDAASSSTATLRDNERDHIVEALQRSRWRIRGVGGAAEILGIKPTTLEARIQKLGIRRNS